VLTDNCKGPVQEGDQGAGETPGLPAKPERGEKRSKATVKGEIGAQKGEERVSREAIHKKIRRDQGKKL